MAITGNKRARRKFSTWATQVELTSKKITKAIAFKLHARIKELTPVDTGRARASWNIVSGPVADLSTAEATRPVSKMVVALPDADVYTISNNLPYIWPLEEGHSGQAPRGMVKVAVAEVRLKGAKAYLT